MKKFRFAAVLGAAAVMFGALPQISVSAATECYDDQGVRYSLDTSTNTATATVIGVKTSVTEITIPETVTLYEAGVPYQAKVTELKNSAFNNDWTTTSKNSLKKVTITAPITEIPGSAFRKCESLTSVQLPRSVTVIGDSAFSQSGITDLSFLQNTSVQTIKDSAFSGCQKLTSAVIPDTVTNVGHLMGGVFYDCSALKTVNLPQNPEFTKIYNQTFMYCHALTSITIPNTVIKISDSAFKECESLTEIRIPKSVTEIGNSVFQDCTSLKDLYIYNAGCKIGDYLCYFYLFDSASRLIYIHAAKGSTAQTYVEDYSVDGAKSNGKDYGYRFVELGTEIDNYGDFDQNGKIDLSDAQNVLNYSVMLSIGIVDGTDTDTIMACDVDRDGEVTITDAQLVLIYYVLNDIIGTPTAWSDLVK